MVAERDAIGVADDELRLSDERTALLRGVVSSLGDPGMSPSEPGSDSDMMRRLFTLRPGLEVREVLAGGRA